MPMHGYLAKQHHSMDGLSQMVITDPDSKFKGEFKATFDLLGIQHHLSARGNHNAILVERFNKFLNSGLRVFDNDRGTNRVFLEGAQKHSHMPGTHVQSSEPISADLC
jgi:hypothetical protein